MLLAGRRRGVMADFTVPELVWVASAVLAPFDAVLLLPYTLLGVHFSPPRLAMLAAVATGLLAAAWTGRVRLRADNVFMVVFLSWFGWNLMSGLWAVSHTAYGRYIALMAMNGLLLLSVLHIATSAHKYHVILKGVLWIVLVTALFGVAELVLGYRVPASRQWAFRDEITSVFVNPAHFGGALAMFAPFALVYPVWLPRPRPRVMVGAAVVLALAAYMILRSGARGAVLGLVLGCATALVLSLAQRRAMRRLTALAAVLAVIAALAAAFQLTPSVPEALGDKLASLRDPVRLIAGEYRLVLREVGWQLWTKSPVVGWGAGASEFLLFERAPWLTAYALHSWDLETLVNTGVVGTALWGLLAVGTALGLLRRFLRGSSAYTRLVASSLLGGLAASAMISLTVGSLMTFPLFWVHLGLCASFASLPRGTESELVSPRPRRTGRGRLCSMPKLSTDRAGF